MSRYIRALFWLASQISSSGIAARASSWASWPGQPVRRLEGEFRIRLTGEISLLDQRARASSGSREFWKLVSRCARRPDGHIFILPNPLHFAGKAVTQMLHQEVVYPSVAVKGRPNGIRARIILCIIIIATVNIAHASESCQIEYQAPAHDGYAGHVTTVHVGEDINRIHEFSPGAAGSGVYDIGSISKNGPNYWDARFLQGNDWHSARIMLDAKSSTITIREEGSHWQTWTGTYKYDGHKFAIENMAMDEYGFYACIGVPDPMFCGNKDVYAVELANNNGWVVCSGYKFLFRQDGNLVLYSPAGTSNTANKGATVLKMQRDGNLVIYGSSGALWATNTSGNTGAYLAIQEDGNVVIYSNAKQRLWSIK